MLAFALQGTYGNMIQLCNFKAINGGSASSPRTQLVVTAGLRISRTGCQNLCHALGLAA
jgi:hypothetical protein